MKQFLLRGLLDQKAKATDPEFVDLKNAVQKTAKAKNTGASLRLLRNGDTVLKVDDDAVCDQMIDMLKSLPNVTVSGVSSALEAYVQQRLQKSASTK